FFWDAAGTDQIQMFSPTPSATTKSGQNHRLVRLGGSVPNGLCVGSVAVGVLRGVDAGGSSSNSYALEEFRLRSVSLEPTGLRAWLCATAPCVETRDDGTAL